MVAPPLLILIALLGSDRYLKTRVSGPLSKTLTWLAAGLMSIAAVAVLATTFIIS